MIGLWSVIGPPAVAGNLPGPVDRAEFPIPGATSVMLGRDLFYDPILSGNRNIACGTCHNPAFGSADGVALSLGEGARGIGRDRYRFRTPSLRNVTLTAPYGHNGAYATIKEMIRHHTYPGAGIATHPAKGSDHPAMKDADEMTAVYAANTLPRAPLNDREIGALATFLGALTDPVSRQGRVGVPGTVPSGLPVTGREDEGS